jgi:mannose-6-phosphate isomerase-like protein (cupin superfamily)
MTAAEFIGTGILESYCLGFTSTPENEMVEQMARENASVQAEIDKIRDSLADVLLKNTLQPSPKVKTNVMHTIYASQAERHKEFVPLMHRPVEFTRYYQAAEANLLITPTDDFENLFVKELPSTPEVINFAVWAKKGHEEEIHNDRNEYLAVLSGSCDMFMDGKKRSFSQGEVIAIDAGISHYAVITSVEPMFALVQRQLL